MILSDNEIHQRLAELNVKAANANFAFDANKQVQPCSIDLRLDNTIWKPTLKGILAGPIDLSNQTPLGPQITNAFRKAKLSSKGLLLRPRQFVLGRTYESFCMPPDLMGRLTGRSSIGRLGLSVVAPSSFINPGWKGHMPLMLINHSPFSIRLQPFLGIIQLCLFSMSSPPKNVYGVAAGSKYVDEDDGGPSQYWLDYSIDALRENLNLHRANKDVAAKLLALSKELDETTRSRLMKRIEATETIPDFHEFVESFVNRERLRPVLILLLPIILGALLGLLIGWQWTWQFIVGLAITIALLIWVCWTQWGTTMGAEDIRQAGRRVGEK